MNNHLRNMIGHCSYEINNITQIVKYKNGQKTLVEITYYCYQLILELLNSFCIVTLLHELYLSDTLLFLKYVREGLQEETFFEDDELVRKDLLEKYIELW